MMPKRRKTRARRGPCASGIRSSSRRTSSAPPPRCRTPRSRSPSPAAAPIRDPSDRRRRRLRRFISSSAGRRNAATQPAAAEGLRPAPVGVAGALEAAQRDDQVEHRPLFGRQPRANASDVAPQRRVGAVVAAAPIPLASGVAGPPRSTSSPRPPRTYLSAAADDEPVPMSARRRTIGLYRRGSYSSSTWLATNLTSTARALAASSS